MVSTDSHTVHHLLDVARSMRLDTGSLVARLAAEGAAREVELLQLPATLDHLIREGNDPAALAAFLQRIQGLKAEAAARDASVHNVVKAFGDLYEQLEATHDAIPDETVERVLLKGEMRLCAGVMAALGEQSHRCTMEAGVVAALADGQRPRIIAPVERRSASGLIILPAQQG
jgi:hypothetical protein